MKSQFLKDFDRFLIVMDEQLDALASEAEKRGITLDKTLDDLESLEKLFDLLALGKSREEQLILSVSFARHLGEVVRINYGGKWALPLGDQKNVNYNKPVIMGHSKVNNLEFAPLNVMRAYALRRKPGTLKRAVEAGVNPEPLDLSDLVEDE